MSKYINLRLKKKLCVGNENEECDTYLWGIWLGNNDIGQKNQQVILNGADSLEENFRKVQKKMGLSLTMKLLFGTGNPAKLSVMKNRLKQLDIELIGLKDLVEKGYRIPEVPENGNTPLENARQKALAYYEAFKMPVFSCDSGLYFDNVPDEVQPGVHVRNVKGKYLSDEEMTEYYAGLVRQYGNLIARYRNAICFVMDGEHIYESMAPSLESERFILTDKPHSAIRKKGFPLDSISIDIKTNRYYYDLPSEELKQFAAEDGFLAFFQEVIEKYLQTEKQAYSRMQSAAKQTIEYIKKTIQPGMNLIEIRKTCEEKLLESGADSFWYWDVGAFVFAGDETTVSVSGRQYVTADRVIGSNDIITIDLSPQVGNIWGDYARTVIVENGKVVDDINMIENAEWKSGLQMEEELHKELLHFVTKETTFEELYYHMNELIVEKGFVNLDFMGNLGHSIVKTKGDRVYIEKGNTRRLGDVNYFTFEPHIALPNSKYGYKKENIYYFDGDMLIEL